MPTSKRQDAYLHAQVYPVLATLWRETEARAKLIVLGGCFGWKMSTWTGHWLPVKASTTELTVAEGARLIDWIVAWAEERGIALERPAKQLEDDDDERI